MSEIGKGKLMKKSILVTQPSMPPIEEYIEEIRDLWETHWLTNMGEKHKCLQTELCKYLMVDNIELLTNGHMALELTMQAMKLQGEVITTPYTFASTTHAIVRNGLMPVFCDINPMDFTIDVSQIEEKITNKTAAIVPVHVYGNVCNVEEIEHIARKHGLKVIYDAAHAFGVQYMGKGIGSFGDAACFSFHATKAFNTIEGGAVSYKDQEFGLELYRLKNFGIRNAETIDGVGANAKMNEFCAAMGLCNLRHIEDETSKRKNIVYKYRELLDGVPGIQLNQIQSDVKRNYAYFPIVIDESKFGADRDEVYDSLVQQNIMVRKYFYPTTNAFDCYKDIFDANTTPRALSISKRVLTLPLYADLNLDDVAKICNVIIGCKKNR